MIFVNYVRGWGLAPAEGLYSVYVIDEVHMLTTEAFNALLKTLEEPPEHAVFILCTTEPHKLPDTIISRCTRIQFYKATQPEVLRSLSKAIVGEKLKVSKAVLELIAARVDGSFRDGMKVLEQLASNKGDITEEMVDELTGYSRAYDASGFVDLLLVRDVDGLLEMVRTADQLGVDFGGVCVADYRGDSPAIAGGSFGE